MNPETEIRDLLRAMSLLSEANTGSFDRPIKSGKPQTKPPPGYGKTTTPNGTPDENFSLYEHFSYRFDNAGSELQQRVIVCQARVALRERQKGPEPWRLEKAERTEAEEIDILIKDGEGVHSAELAATTGWPQSWIHTQRERHGREPERGHPRPNWQALTSSERRSKAQRLCKEGYSCRKAARELGIAHTTLARYWPKEEVA